MQNEYSGYYSVRYWLFFTQLSKLCTWKSGRAIYKGPIGVAGLNLKRVARYIIKKQGVFIYCELFLFF